MSHIYLIISDTKIDIIQKERFLKFNRINCLSQHNFYGYFRYDEQNCENLLNDGYNVSSQLNELLKTYLQKTNRLFFSRYLLQNKENEIDVFDKMLKIINKNEVSSIKIDIFQDLTTSHIYQIT